MQLKINNSALLWGRGFIASLVGGAASSISAAVADPTQFNLTAAGLQRLKTVAVIGAIGCVAAYLVKSPLPFPCGHEDDPKP